MMLFLLLAGWVSGQDGTKTIKAANNKVVMFTDNLGRQFPLQYDGKRYYVILTHPKKEGITKKEMLTKRYGEKLVKDQQ